MLFIANTIVSYIGFMLIAILFIFYIFPFIEYLIDSTFLVDHKITKAVAGIVNHNWQSVEYIKTLCNRQVYPNQELYIEEVLSSIEFLNDFGYLMVMRGENNKIIKCKKRFSGGFGVFNIFQNGSQEMPQAA